MPLTGSLALTLDSTPLCPAFTAHLPLLALAGIELAPAPSACQSTLLRHTPYPAPAPAGAIAVACHCRPSAPDPFHPGDSLACTSPLLPYQLAARLDPCFLTREVLPGVLGWSPAIAAVAAQVPRMAAADATCLLLGETGTGKELFARALHYLGPRHASPFVPLNCGAVAEHLFESELFGHLPGAFTDARSRQQGLLAFAEGGTLFLDEVDALSPAAQVKLLRLLQEREYRPLGSPRTVRANVRVVAATNADLPELVAARAFREDLFYRLNILRLTLPPLRSRPEDLPLLALHFVREQHCPHLAIRPTHLTAAALARLAAHPWPGNVRELHAVLHRALILHPGPHLPAEALDLPIPCTAAQVSVPHASTLSPLASVSTEVAVPHASTVSPSMRGNDETPLRSLTLKAAKQQAIQQFERTYLAGLLETCSGNISRAARLAGKERRSFQRLLRKHDLPAPALISRLEHFS